MAKKSGLGDPLNPVGGPLEAAAASAAAREQREDKLENIDREKIDDIIMSSDVQKGGKIRVERRGPHQQDYLYVCTLKPEQWETERTMEWLKFEFGGGDYQCRTFRSNGQMYKMFSFGIDHRFRGRLDDTDIAKLDPKNKGNDETTNRLLDMVTRPPANDGLKSSDLLRIMEMQSSKGDQTMMLIMSMMQKSQETMATMMAAALSANRQTPSGADTVMPILLEMIKSKQEKTPLIEMMESMAMMKEFMSNDKQEPEEQDMMSKVGKLLGKAAPIIGALTGGQQQQPQPQPRSAEQIPPPKPAGFMLGVIGRMAPANVQQMLIMILKKAEQGSDPALYADLIIDNVEPSQLDMLKGILTEPDWCAKIWGDESRLASIRPWLDQLRQLLLDYDPNSVTGSETIISPEGGASGQPSGPDSNPPVS